MSWIDKALELAERYVSVQERQLATQERLAAAREARDKELSGMLNAAFVQFEKLMPKLPPDLRAVATVTDLPIPEPWQPPKVD